MGRSEHLDTAMPEGSPWTFKSHVLQLGLYFCYTQLKPLPDMTNSYPQRLSSSDLLLKALPASCPSLMAWVFLLCSMIDLCINMVTRLGNAWWQGPHSHHGSIPSSWMSSINNEWWMSEWMNEWKKKAVFPWETLLDNGSFHKVTWRIS